MIVQPVVEPMDRFTALPCTHTAALMSTLRRSGAFVTLIALKALRTLITYI